MNICFDGADRTFDDQLDPHRRRQMKDHVALIYQLRGYRPVVNAVDFIVKARVIFQMLNVTKAAGRKVVNDENFVTAPKISVGKMGIDESRSACDQNSQSTNPIQTI